MARRKSWRGSSKAWPSIVSSQATLPTRWPGPTTSAPCRGHVGRQVLAAVAGGVAQLLTLKLGLEVLPTLTLTMRAAKAGRAEWTASIRDMWTTAAEAFIGAGRELIDAKATLRHGEFEAMVEDDLPFGPRTARRLMAIALDPRIADRTHVSVLPASWRTLYELTRLDDEALERAFAAGDINAEMGRADVARIRRQAAAGDDGGAVEAAACAVEDLYDLAASQTARFGAILADPPWTFETYSAKGKGRSAERHYPCMTDNEIAGLPVTGRTRGEGGHLPAGADHVGAMPRPCQAPGPGGGEASAPKWGARPCDFSNRDPRSVGLGPRRGGGCRRRRAVAHAQARTRGVADRSHQVPTLPRRRGSTSRPRTRPTTPAPCPAPVGRQVLAAGKRRPQCRVPGPAAARIGILPLSRAGAWPGS